MKRIYLSSSQRPQIDQIGLQLQAALKEHAKIETKVVEADNFHCTLEFDDPNNQIDCFDLQMFIIKKLGFNFPDVELSVYNYKPEVKFGFAFTNKASNEFDKKIAQLLELKQQLMSTVYGQAHAVNKVIDGLISAYSTEATRNDDRPFASFILAGAQHTGKTRLAIEVAQGLGLPVYMFGKQEYLLHDPVFIGLQRIIASGKRSVVIFNEFESIDTNLLANLSFINQAGEVGIFSFRNLILFFITSAGTEIYSRKNFFDYAGVSTSEVISALAEERDEYGRPIFYENLLRGLPYDEAVVFNNLSSYTKSLILASAIEGHKKDILTNTNIEIMGDSHALATYVSFAHPEVDNVGVLVKYAFDIIDEQVAFLSKQLNEEGKPLLSQVRKVLIGLSGKNCSEEVKKLFEVREKVALAVCKPESVELLKGVELKNCKLNVVTSLEDAKKFYENNNLDFLFVDPTINSNEQSLALLDVEDFESEGMNAFRHFTRYCNNIPLYLLIDIENMLPVSRYESLLLQGAKGYAPYNAKKMDDFVGFVNYLSVDDEFNDDIEDLRESNMRLLANPKQAVGEQDGAQVLMVALSNLELVPERISMEQLRNDELRLINKMDDILGNDIPKKYLLEASEYLLNTQDYLAKGKIPYKLILLYGLDGSGKTSLIKATAKHAKADIVEYDCKEGLYQKDIHNVFKAIRTTFAHARKMAPAIIHFKNLLYLFAPQAFGPSEELINVLREEIAFARKDKFHPVLVIAEASYRDMYYIDPEFGTLVSRELCTEYHKPEHIEEYFRRFLKRNNITSLSDKAIRNFSRRCMMYGYRDLNDLFEFILLQAAGKEITDAFIADVLDLYRMGDETSSEAVEKEKLSTAYHEMGHYLLMRLAGTKPVFVTIVARGNYGGYTAPGYQDKFTMTKQEYLDEICVDYGGRAAEVILNGEDKGMNTGISGDIRMATASAYDYVARHAMSGVLYSYYDDADSGRRDFGYVVFRHNLDPRVREEMEKVQKEQYERALRLLTLNRENLDKLSQALFEKGFLMGEDAEELVPDDKLIKE